MKKVLLIAAIAFASVASAQKGTILVAGNLGFSSDKNEAGLTTTKTNGFNFSPKVGYQVTDHWTFGIDLSVSSQKNETETTTFTPFPVVTTTETTTSGLSAGVFARYTKVLSETFNVFADMGAGIQNQKVKTPAPFGTTSVTSDGFYIGVVPAVFINVKKNFGLNVSFGGLMFDTLDTPGGTNSGFDFNFGQTVNIGISKNF